MAGLTPLFLSVRSRLCLLQAPSPLSHSPPRRLFHPSPTIMSSLSVDLTAPNGRKYTQPIGLFINNEFVPSKSGEKLASINPR